MPNRTQSHKRDVVLNSITEGVLTVDSDWCITSFNRAGEEITGIPHEKALGRRGSDILRADVCENDCALRETMGTGKPIMNKAVHIVDSKGDQHALDISTALLTVESRLSAFVSVYMVWHTERPDAAKGHSETKCL